MQGPYTQQEKALDCLQYSAVAIIGDQDSRHLGLFYRDPLKGEICLLHLMVYNLRNDDPSFPHYKKFLWDFPDIPEERQSDLAAKALLVRDENQKGRVPYGFSLPDGFFDQATGEMLLGPEKVGLTCATLVLALFHMIGIQLIDYSSWKSRPDDEKEQKKLIGILTSKKYDPVYIKAVERQANGFRYRPEEVMASALTPPEIKTMEKLVPLGEQVVRKIVSTLAIP